MTGHRPIGIYYEHPDWFRPLFDELDRRVTPYVKLPAESHAYDPSSSSDAGGAKLRRISADGVAGGAA